MRSEFDVDPGLIYLNSGTHSLTPRSVLAAASRLRAEYEANPTAGLVAAWGRLWAVQSRLARFFNADPACLFLRQNVTEAMNAFLLGVPLPSGSEILLSDAEYGAVENICRFRAERDGLTVRTFHLPLGREASAADLTERVCAEWGPRTGLLVLSHVLTGTGLVLPLADIARRTRARGILFAVDGAHAAGAVPLDFAALADLDFYGTNLHKWTMGPKGTGFGWVSPRHHEALRPLEAGWATFEPVNDHAAFGGGARFPVRMLMQGCRDFAPFLALADTLDFWERLGAGAIRARIRALQERLENEVESVLGWPRLSPDFATGLRGPLTTFELPARLEKEGPALSRRLRDERRLQVAVPKVQGRWRLRLSPHVYNTDDELVRAVRILRDAALIAFFLLSLPGVTGAVDLVTRVDSYGNVYTYEGDRVTNITPPADMTASERFNWPDHVLAYLNAHKDGPGPDVPPPPRPAEPADQGDRAAADKNVPPITAAAIQKILAMAQGSAEAPNGTLKPVIVPGNALKGRKGNAPAGSKNDLVPRNGVAPNSAALPPAADAQARAAAAARGDRISRRADGLRDDLGRPPSDDASAAPEPDPARPSSRVSLSAGEPPAASAPSDQSGPAFATPRSIADLARAENSPYREAFADAGLKMGVLPSGERGVLRDDGSPASPQQVRRLKEGIAAEPLALLRRPDFYGVLSRESFRQLKADFQEKPDLRAGTFRDVALTPGARDFQWAASCAKVSGSCNRNSSEQSYRRGRLVTPEDLARMFADARKADAAAKSRPAGPGAAANEGGAPGDQEKAARASAGRLEGVKSRFNSFLSAVSRALGGAPESPSRPDPRREEGAGAWRPVAAPVVPSGTGNKDRIGTDLDSARRMPELEVPAPKKPAPPVDWLFWIVLLVLALGGWWLARRQRAHAQKSRRR